MTLRFTRSSRVRRARVVTRLVVPDARSVPGDIGSQVTILAFGDVW